MPQDTKQTDERSINAGEERGLLENEDFVHLWDESGGLKMGILKSKNIASVDPLKIGLSETGN